MPKAVQNILPKALFAVAVVAAVGVVGAARAQFGATPTMGSGYGYGQNNPTTYIDAFDSVYQSSSSTFLDQLDAALALADSAATNDFIASANNQTTIFDQSVKSAEDQFLTSIDQSMSRGESKDQFIASFSSARDTYFNQLNAAKDRLSDALNQTGSNQAKDQFSNAFNTALADYGNTLEAAKNKFADSVNNH